MTICASFGLDRVSFNKRHFACILQENVDMMAEYLPLENFKTIYVVDLCKSLCEQAKKKVDAKGWKNVVVVEGDACTFTPPGEKATLVTFSYSLSSEYCNPGQPLGLTA